MRKGKIASLIMSLLMFVGCTSNNVEVKYVCDKNLFLNAQDCYKAGEEVVLKVELLIGYDYDLEVNDIIIHGELDKEEGVYTYSFTMPKEEATINLVEIKTVANEEGTLIAEYYYSPTAIEGEAEYQEVCLYLKDGIYSIHNFIGSTSTGKTTSHTSREVSRDILKEIDAILVKYDFEDWDQNGCDALDGASYVVKYTNSKGEIVRVSSDWMPENGEEALSAINHLLNSYGENDGRKNN